MNKAFPVIRKNLFLFVMLIFLITSALQVSSPSSGAASTAATASSAASPAPNDAATKILEIGEVEKGILQKLRSLQLDIARDNEGIQALSSDLARLQGELEVLDARMETESASLKTNREALRIVLVRYQMSGPGSQMELLLSSDSLATFLRRLGIMRDLNHETGILLDRLKENKRLLDEQLAEKQVVLTGLQDQRAALEQALQAKKTNEAGLEASLTALAADRAGYEEQLARMEAAWNLALGIFPKLTDGFSRIVSEGAFPQDALEMTFSFFGVSASLKEKTFSDILSGDKRMLGAIFRFHPERVTLEVPDAGLILEGTFTVVDGIALQYEVLSGTQGGMPLEPAQAAELSKNGPLLFGLEPILQGGKIDKVKVLEGSLTLDVSISLF